MIDGTSPIEDLGLKQRTLQAVKNLGIGTVGDLIALTEDLLLARLTKLQCRDIRNSLSVSRLQLQPSPDPDLDTAKVRPLGPTNVPSIPALLESLSDGRRRENDELLQQLLASDELSGEGIAKIDDVSQRAFGKPFPKRGQRKRRSDDERADNFARRRLSRFPRRDNPDDVARIDELRNSYTMDAPDAAWLLGISVDLVYAGCVAGTIPNIHIRKRYKIVTARLFAMLTHLEQDG